MSYDDQETEEMKNCFCEAETAKAILVRLPTGEKKWIPKSVLGDESECWGAATDRATGKLVVHRWWAEQNGIE